MGKTPELPAAHELDNDKLIANAKSNALELALTQADSKVVEFEALALVDLQGIYLRLHEVLSGVKFPIESGAVIGRLAALQINEVFYEIQRAVQRKCGSNVGILSDLFDQIKVKTVDGKAYLAEEVRVLKGGTYLNVLPTFEVFYAVPPLDKIKWALEREARTGGREARLQLEKIKRGILRTAYFERDYKHFAEFVETVKGNLNFRRAEEGFFTFGVGPKGLERYDEKQVDARIVMRAMEALYEKQADALCIVSSDQDFLPLKEKCGKFGVQFFQADVAKFMAGAHVGRRIEELSDHFIRGKFNPEWPLEVLCDFLSAGDESSYGVDGISEMEVRALASLHNLMNDYEIHVSREEDDMVRLRLSRPLVSGVTTRIDSRTKMKQVLINALEY